MEEFVPFNPAYLADVLNGRLPGAEVPKVEDSLPDDAPAPVSPESAPVAAPAEAGVPVASSEDEAPVSQPEPPAPAPKAPASPKPVSGIPSLAPVRDDRADALFGSK